MVAERVTYGTEYGVRVPAILYLPNWSEDTVRDMPVSKMTDWAKANGVETDRLYATESSEGGTQAIGTGVPGLTCDQLGVFSRAEWEQRKESVILETRVRQARAAPGRGFATSDKSGV